MSALFYDYSIKLPSNCNQICSAWCHTDSIIAVALSNRSVKFYNDEGEPLLDKDHTRNSQVAKMAWQPRGKNLAVGWTDGIVSIWNAQDKMGREINSPHKSRIQLIKWTPSGNRLLSGDEDGLLVVWKADARGQLTIACQYRKHGVLTQCVFCTNSQLREKELRSESFSKHTCPSFFFGGELGAVHYADDLGHISDVQQLNHAIDSMMYFEEKSRLVIITRALQLMQLQVSSDGTVRPIMKVKLSIAGDDGVQNTIWAGPGVLATSSSEPIIRLWDLSADENYILSLSSAGSSIKSSDRITCIDFNPRKRMLAAGTKDGAVVFWQYIGSSGKQNASEACWEIVSTANVEYQVISLGWNPNQSIVFADTEKQMTLLHEAIMHRSIKNDVSVSQITSKSLSIELFKDGSITKSTAETSIRIKGISHDGNSVVVWNGTKAEVFEVSKINSRKVAQFKSSSDAMCLRGDSIFCAVGNHVEILNIQGIVKNTISFSETEGRPILLDLNGKYLAVGTDCGLLRVFDLSRRDPKAVGSIGNCADPSIMGDNGNQNLVLKSICLNSDGTKISILMDKVAGSLRIRTPHSKLFLYNTDLNVFHSFEFGPSRHPISHFWDPEEPRLLACESIAQHFNNSDTSIAHKAENTKDSSPEKERSDLTDLKNSKPFTGVEVVSLFASNDLGLLMQDSFELNRKYEAMAGIHVPRMFFIAKKDLKDSDIDSDTSTFLRTQIMRDFIGLDKVDAEARKALIDFSYFMTIGNMDEAYRAVKLIENPSVWENMAHMCVKTKRLDVAEVCFGNMGHARGAEAVQLAKKEPELESAIAMVAIQLGLLDDAARLYKECGRYDLLNNLYQYSGYWSKALDIAAEKDRIHLKTTHYKYAVHLESMKHYKDATYNYELADMHHKEVPRMRYNKRQFEVLESYVYKTNDNRLTMWWGQYMESNQRFDKALKLYKQAEDALSQVRVLCYDQNFDLAEEIVEQTKSRSAAYYLARQFEASDMIKEAICYYAKGECYTHAIRLSKEYQLDTDLMNFALLSKPSQMLSSANYFEEKGEFDKAVQLYQKGGDLEKALDLCFNSQLFDELKAIAVNLGEKTPPSLLSKCADFFMNNGHYAKAVNLLVMGKRYDEVLTTCIDHDVKITDEMAEKMTLPKCDAKDTAGNARRMALLQKLAKCCKQQGSYHLATKKYTQAGDKLKAMKCLLKSGDTEKVVFFAGVSRNKEIYILAANYLQNLDWHNDPDIMKNISGFYSKAKAFDQLSSFYDACAQVEIDEYKDYEKAISALKEALKYISKSRSDSKEDSMKSLQQRIYLVEKFVEARGQRKRDPLESVRIVQQLLEEPDIETAIRVGDAYALLVEYYYSEDNMDQAYELLETMKQRRIVLKTYVSSKMLRVIYDKVGVQYDADSSRKDDAVDHDADAEDKSADDDDNVDEDIEEDFDSSMHDEYKS